MWVCICVLPILTDQVKNGLIREAAKWPRVTQLDATTTMLLYRDGFSVSSVGFPPNAEHKFHRGLVRTESLFLSFLQALVFLLENSIWGLMYIFTMMALFLPPLDSPALWIVCSIVVLWIASPIWTVDLCSSYRELPLASWLLRWLHRPPPYTVTNFWWRQFSSCYILLFNKNAIQHLEFFLNQTLNFVLDLF